MRFKFKGREIDIESEDFIEITAPQNCTIRVASTIIEIQNGMITINGDVNINGNLTVSGNYPGQD